MKSRTLVASRVHIAASMARHKEESVVSREMDSRKRIWAPKMQQKATRPCDPTPIQTISLFIQMVQRRGHAPSENVRDTETMCGATAEHAILAFVDCWVRHGGITSGLPTSRNA